MSIYVNARFLTQRITGVQRYAIEISRQLKMLSTDIKFVAPGNIIHDELAGELNVVAHGKMSGHLWEQLELPRFLKKRGYPLLINLGNTSPLHYKNKIVAIYDMSFMRNPQWFSKKFYLYYKFIVARAAREALKIITVSEFSKKEIHELLNIPADNIEVVYGAAPKESEDDIGKDISQRGRYLLAVSSLDPRKNLENLIAAFISSGIKGVKLIIVGSGNTIFRHKKFREVIGSNPDIIFTGYVSDRDLIGLYKRAELFIYPSIYEGFGIPPLEAMACGCPVIVSTASSLPEVCGDAALYVDPYDIDDIKRAMSEILDNRELRQELILKGRTRAKLFSWNDSAIRLLKIIQGVVNNENSYST